MRAHLSERGGTGEIRIECPLNPIIQKSVLVVRVNNSDGDPLEDATVVLKGPVEAQMVTDTKGRATRDIEPGDYSMLVEKDGYLKKVKTFEAATDTRSEIEVSLSDKPESASVVIRKKRIVIKKKIHFATDSDEIEADSFGLLDEIADVLISNPQLKRIEIQGHTDNRGKRDYNLDLSSRRGESVRQYLVNSGVEGQRLESKGFGPDKPIAPNITSQGRARNRRVEFHILERSEE